MESASGISATSTTRPVAISAARLAAEPRHTALFTPLEKTARPARRMERDDRGHRGEAHLEARPGEGFGPEQQHDEGAGGDQADADCVAAERDAGEDQHRRDATSTVGTCAPVSSV